jgi:hypothetical protein
MHRPMGGHKGDVTVVKDWNLIVQLKVQRLARADAIWRKVKSRGLFFSEICHKFSKLHSKQTPNFFYFSKKFLLHCKHFKFAPLDL